jgi:hypothetical protein
MSQAERTPQYRTKAGLTRTAGNHDTDVMPKMAGNLLEMAKLIVGL